MNTYMIRYILPVTLRISESEEFTVEIGNGLLIIKCKHIEGITAISYLENNMNWIKDTGTIAYVRSTNTNGEEIDALKLYLNNDIDLQCDGYVEVSQHTVIDVIIQAENRNEAIRGAKIGFEKFLSTYKYIFSEENIRTVALNESKIVQVFKATKVYQQKDWEDIILKPLETTIQWDDPFEKGLKTKKLDSAKILTFADRLKASDSIPIWLKIFLDAKDQAILNKNFSMSIVLVETAFECFLQNILIGSCKKQNLQMIPNWRGENVDVLEVIEGANINKLIKVYIPLLLKASVEGTLEHKRWEENVCKKRNAIIHRGYTVNTEEEAKESFNDVQNFFNCIKELI